MLSSEITNLKLLLSSFARASELFYSVKWNKVKGKTESVFWVLIGIAKISVNILQKLPSNVQCLNRLFHNLAA